MLYQLSYFRSFSIGLFGTPKVATIQAPTPLFWYLDSTTENHKRTIHHFLMN